MQMLSALSDREEPAPQWMLADGTLDVPHGTAVGTLMPAASLGPDEDAARTIDFYAARAARIRSSGAGVLWLRGFEDPAHSRLAVLGARKTGLPIIYCMEPEKGNLDPALARMLCLQELGVSAFELCGAFDAVEPALEHLLPYAKLPIAALPDYGEPRTWVASVRWLLEAGARILGVPKDALACLDEITPLFAEYENIPLKPRREAVKAPIRLTDSTQLFFLDEDYALSEPLHCGLDMTRAIVEAEDSANAVLIAISTDDDAEYFAANLGLLRAPVCLLADSADALERALAAYPGLALLDARGEIEENVLAALAASYGAVVR